MAPRNLPAFAAAPVLVLVALKLAIHFATNGGYGYFRDELYFIACGEHLDWGYVDQPPLIAVAAWATRKLLGDSLFAIRFFPATAGALVILLTGMITRELGGGRYAQVLACVAALAAPIYLAMGTLLTMNAFEPVFWMGCAYAALRIFNGGSGRWWLAFGAFAGVGLQNKHSMMFFGAAFVAGVLLSHHRRQFLTPWPWLGGALAVLIFLPNLIWLYQHDWATFRMLENVRTSTKNTPLNPWSFFTGQVLLVSPAAAPLWLAGLGWLLFSKRAAGYRPFGIAYVVLYALFIALKGKVYYIAPFYPVLLGAGAVAFEMWLAQRRLEWPKPAAAGALAVAGVVLAPMVLPVLPVETFIRYQRALGVEPPRTETMRLAELPQLYADMFGWPEMAQTVAGVYNRLSPEDRSRCGIFAQNYGQAGAIDFFGPRLGLPKAISGHQNYFFWGSRGYTGECLIVLDDRREVLEYYFASVEEVAMVHHPYAIPYENNKPVHLCRGMKWPLAEIWPKLKKWI